MRQYGLSRLEVRDGDTHVLLETPKRVDEPIVVTAPSTIEIPKMKAEKPTIPISEPQTNAHCQKSPLVGTLYLAPSEDSPRFVEVGTKVKKGDTLCIVEAMKVLNELTAETDGVIVEVCGKNAAVVEFGQPLFLIERG